MAVDATNKKKKSTAPKKVEASEKVAEIPKTSEALENEALKKQIEAQNAQMLRMQAQMEAMMKMMGNNTAPVESSNNDNRLVRFVSLTDATIVLKGTNFWTIEGGRYSYRDFPEKEARVIALNMSEFLRSGSVYIADAEFVRKNDLEIVYETLLSDTDLKTLLDKNVADVIETYQSVNENQKEIIIESIIADKKAGKVIDNNILVALGSLCGKNLVNLDDEE